MAYGVGLRFDETTEKQVIDVWRQLSALGVTTALSRDGYFPHVSMILSETLQVDAFINEISQALKAVAKIQLHFSSVSLFAQPDIVLYYGITPTTALLGLHTLSYEVYYKHATKLNQLYLPEAWVPHCGLAIRIDEEKLKASIDIARTIRLPYSAQSVEYVIVEHDGQRAEVLQSFQV
ncbi:MAG: 2'-5' RNA ligase family protein [Chloroflexota bacterium]